MGKLTIFRLGHFRLGIYPIFRQTQCSAKFPMLFHKPSRDVGVKNANEKKNRQAHLKHRAHHQATVRAAQRGRRWERGTKYYKITWNSWKSWRMMYHTVKGQSRSDSLLLSPYHWAKLFRGVVAIVAVPMRFAVICWIVLEASVGQIHVFPLGSWMTIQVLGLSRPGKTNNDTRPGKRLQKTMERSTIFNG